MSNSKKITGLAVATLLVTGLVACKSEAMPKPQAKSMEQGYQNSTKPMGGMMTKDAEGKCGEGKCAAAPAPASKNANANCGASAEKMGSANCGASANKNANANCGASK